MCKSPDAISNEITALAAKPERDIDYSDIPATSSADWQGAERGRFYHPINQQTSDPPAADIPQ
jgi:hypothetical protein